MGQRKVSCVVVLASMIHRQAASVVVEDDSDLVPA